MSPCCLVDPNSSNAGQNQSQQDCKPCGIVVHWQDRLFSLSAMARLTLAPKRIAAGLRRAGFADSVIPVMTAVAMAESAGHPRAHNQNHHTGDNSYGLLQINMIGEIGAERRQLLDLRRNEDLFVPRVNFRAAKLIYDQQGLEAWGAYKNGSYLQFISNEIKTHPPVLDEQEASSQISLFVVTTFKWCARINRRADAVLHFPVDDASKGITLKLDQADLLFDKRFVRKLKRKVVRELMGNQESFSSEPSALVSLLIADPKKFNNDVEISGRIKSFKNKSEKYRLVFDVLDSSKLAFEFDCYDQKSSIIDPLVMISMFNDSSEGFGAPSMQDAAIL